MCRPRPVLLSVLTVCFCAFPTLAQRRPVTIKDVIDPRFRETPGTPVWSPDSFWLAYREAKRVVLYDVANRRERSVEAPANTDIKAREGERFAWVNRRARSQPLQWLPDSRALMVLAGGVAFRLEPRGGELQKLAFSLQGCSDPKLSPDGALLSYVRAHDLYLRDFASGQERRLTTDGTDTRRNGEPDWVYPEELSLASAQWWSPDGKQLAFLQFDISQEMLYPHADLLGRRALYEPEHYPQAGTPNAKLRLGVADVQTGSLRWLDVQGEGDTLIPRVQWVPAGDRLLVQRLNREQTRLELFTVRVSDGARQTVLTETDAAWVNYEDDVTFLPDGQRFLWPSERDGFRHLYVYTLAGVQERQLTRGSWQVVGAPQVQSGTGDIWYTSTEASPLERQVYRIKPDGTSKTRLTVEAGTHSLSLSPNGQSAYGTFSDRATPPRRTLHGADGRLLAAIREPDRSLLSQVDFLPSEIVSFASEGRTYYGRVLKPRGFQPGRQYPAVVLVYGGPHSQSVRNNWAGLGWDQVLASRGFVVWEMDNRGTQGRGKAWETAVARELGRREWEDQQRGLQYLLGLGFVDPQRLGLYGWSYGGFMTLYGLTHFPDRFRAAIAGAPVTDWHNYDTIYTERYLGLPSANEQGYRLSSPVHDARRLKARLLLAHNVEDDNVLFQNTMQWVTELEKAGKRYDLLIYPQKTHGVTDPLREHLLEQTTAFFERELLPAAPASTAAVSAGLVR